MPTPPSPHRLVLLFGGAILVILLAGAWFFTAQSHRLRQEAVAMLQGIAQLKVEQITAWRDERLGDAHELRDSPLFVQGVARYFTTNASADAAPLLARFHALQRDYHYAGMLLVDAADAVRLSLNARPGAMSPTDVDGIAQARHARVALLTELTSTPANPTPHLGVVTPLFTTTGRYLGAIVMRIDAAQYLYPMIQSWPTPSPTAETLLVRRDGEDALFLNELRFQRAAAFQLRIPLTNTRIPAVQAVLGHTGMVEGPDYRGVDVVSVIQPVPQSTWYMIAKVDAAEIFAEWHFHALATLALILVLCALLAGAGFSFWQRTRRAHLEALYAAEAARRADAEGFGITLRSIGDAVITTDARGRVTLLNPGAETLTGWSHADACGKPLDVVFMIVNEGSRQPVESPVTRVLREGVVVGLANHTLLIARDGTERPIADSGAPIRDADGHIIGVVLVFRDVSVEYRHNAEREHTLALLQASRAKLEAALESMTDAVFISDVEGDFINFNEAFVTFHRFAGKDDCARNFMEYLDSLDVCFPDGTPAPVAQWAVPRALRGETVTNTEYHLRRKDTGETWVGSYSFAPIRDAAGAIVGAVVAGRDITAQKHADAALRESEARYRELFETMQESMFVVDIITDAQGEPCDWRYVDVNPQVLCYLQMTREQLVGHRYREVLPYPDPEWIRLLGAVALSGDPVSRELYSHNGDRWMLVSAYSPHAGQAAVFYSDITERRQHTQEIQRLTRLYAVLSHVNQAVVHALDADSFLTEAIRAVVEEGGFIAGWIGRADPETHCIVPVAIAGPAADYVRKIHVRTDDTPEGHGPIGTAVREARSYVCNDFLSDPQTTPWRTAAAPYGLHGTAGFPILAHGRVWGALALYSDEIGFFGDKEVRLLEEAAYDIGFALDNLAREAERKVVEAERERLATAFEQAAEVMVITDTAGLILYVNPAFERVTGYTAAEVIGQNPRVLKSGLQDDAYYRTLWETITRGETWEGRFVNKKKDGTHFTEDATISPVRDDAGTIISFVAVKRDITHVLDLEAQFLQAQKMEVVGRLAGGIAHDFNNILTGILGFTDLALCAVPDNAALCDDLQEVQRLGLRAADLTRQLLAFSRRQALVMGAVDLNTLVDTTTKMLRRLLGEDITLRVTLGHDLPTVKADAGQLEQVILNLALNARDAMPHGGTLSITTVNDMRVSVERHAPPEACVTLTVTDTGVGMSEEVLAHIFEPFFTTKANGKGTGLGLATVYGIIKQHGGSVAVASVPEQGTTFTLCLPPMTTPAALSPASATPLTTGAEAILLVEDEEAVRDIAARMLRRMGYTVYIANDGEDAERLFASRARHVALLLTDIVMPGINGLELYHRLASVRPDLRVLYMSGYTEDVIVHHGVLDTGVILLQKPFTSEMLARKVREALDMTPAETPGR